MNGPLGRYAIGLYAVLCTAVGLNLLFLQPISLRHKLKYEEVSGGSGAKETAAIESVKKKSQTLTSPSPQTEETSLTQLIEKSLSFPDLETLKEKDSIQALQRGLEAKGYFTGGSNGILSAVTQGAILAFEFDHHLPLTGEPKGYLIAHILDDKKNEKDLPPSEDMGPSPSAEKIIRSVQQALIRLGYRLGSEDGRLGERTIASIRQLELQLGMPETGRISGELIARLNRISQNMSTSKMRE